MVGEEEDAYTYIGYSEKSDILKSQCGVTSQLNCTRTLTVEDTYIW